MTHTNIYTIKQFTIKAVLSMLLVFVFIPGFAQQAKTYDEAIILGDQNFDKQYYLDAKAYYQMAVRFKAKDPYATSQIGIIVAKMKENLKEEEAYYEVIDLADVLYEEKAFDKALEQYREALEIMPDDEYARKQMDSILKSKSDDKEKNDSFSQALEGGKRYMITQQYNDALASFEKALLIYPDHEIVEELITQTNILQAEYTAKKASYDEKVVQAERYILVKDYPTALTHYTEALEIFPDDIYVSGKIAEYTPVALKQKSYQTQLEAADNLYMGKDFNAARKKYQEAAILWPDDPYPLDMVSRIEEQVTLQLKDLDKNYQLSLDAADSLMAIPDYTNAKSEYNLALTLKPGAAYPTSKLEEIDAVFANERKAQEANYQKLLTKADSLFDVAAYTPAAEQYQLALSMRPDDSYPTQKLEEINAQLLLLAAAARKDQQYNNLIAEADQLFSSRQYDVAIVKYEEAKGVKPEEAYPEKQLAEIQMMLADAEKQKELDEKYTNQLLVAQRFFSDNKLDLSKQAYAEALNTKPYEVEPKKQIAFIDSLQIARIEQEKIDRTYAAHIKSGDSLQGLGLYAAAILAFEHASSVKPAEAEARQRIATVESIQKEIAAAKAAQETYDKAIREADQYFSDRSYELAKTEYQNALAAKPMESYPETRIAELDNLLEQLAAEREQRYIDAIAKADGLFDVNKLEDALLEYKIALSIKPDESHPKAQIEACNIVLAEKMRRLKTEYDVAVVEADKLYAAKVYDKAIQAYQNAESIKADETYPREMIDSITRFIEENAITDIISGIITINSGTTERFEFEPIPIKVRKSNYVFVKAKNIDGEAFKIIFTYGSDKGKNGGFVVQVPAGTEYNDFIIRVGNQYKWFSEDNNWLSIYPENGNVEVNLVRISKTN